MFPKMTYELHISTNSEDRIMKANLSLSRSRT